jgi:hypothetical protein
MASFTSPIPTEWAADPEKAAFMRDLVLLLNDLVSPEGVIATSTATTEVVLTQQEKLDLMTVTQAVDLDTVESQAAAATAALAVIQNSLPDYVISNDGTLRTLNADDAAGAISPAVTQAEVENIRDAVLLLADFVATMNRDLQNKDIFG